MISSLDQRLAFMADLGLDGVLVVEFTPEFSALTPEEFVRQYLVDGLHAAVVCLGKDVRFGAGNRGDLGTLITLGERYGFDVDALEDVGNSPRALASGVPSVVPPVTDSPLRHPTAAESPSRHPAVAEGGSQDLSPANRISSSAIRQALAEGDVATAALMLGRAHRVSGQVVHGDHRGRTLGFPTANLGNPTGMIPADGVYAGWLLRSAPASSPLRHPESAETPLPHPAPASSPLRHPAAAEGGSQDLSPANGTSLSPTLQRLPAAISVGTNPTFNGQRERRIEAYVLDRTDLDLYGEDVTVELEQRVRGTEKFDDANALITQMRDDVTAIRSLLANPTPPS
jgi:riboflavin kinase/FMN adenylyltransferase